MAGSLAILGVVVALGLAAAALVIAMRAISRWSGIGRSAPGGEPYAAPAIDTPDQWEGR